VALGSSSRRAKKKIQRADHVVYLGEARVSAVNHRIGGRALLGEVDYRIGLKAEMVENKKFIVGHVTT